MDTNAIADFIGDWLNTGLYDVGGRIYRNEAVQNAVYPYIVYRIEDKSDTYPSADLTVRIDVYEAPHVSVRVVEAVADEIEADFNHKVFPVDDMYAHFELEQRQSVNELDLIDAYFVNLRFVTRIYN